MKTSSKALAAHRRVAKNLRRDVWIHVGFVLFSSAMLVVASKQGWHWFIRVVCGLSIASAVIGLLADFNALSDRKKLIVKIEGAHEPKAEPTPEGNRARKK